MDWVGRGGKMKGWGGGGEDCTVRYEMCFFFGGGMGQRRVGWGEGRGCQCGSYYTHDSYCVST